MADGHVHVYGRLRGRVAAGVAGYNGAEIFCVMFEPELVSIGVPLVGPNRYQQSLSASAVRLDTNAQTLTFTSMG